DVARKLGVPVSEVEKLTKQIKDTDTLSKAEKTKKIKLILDTNETLKDVFEKAKKIEGLPRQSSTHAAGIVLSKQSISDVVPLQEGYNGINQTQYAMNYLEENGLLKIDFLGLRNLTFIKETIKLIDKDIDIDNIDLNDKKALKLLANGSTGGIFQMESPGMTKVLRELKPTIFEDIIATTSLFRPGPIKSIPYYIKRKHGKEKVESIDPSIDSILEPTFGLIIYQEQIMKIAQEYAGLSLAEADSLRRAIGKKDSALMQSLVKEFKLGAATKGRNEDTTNKIIQFIEEFASYGFNRSHAFAYSIISMQLA
ncbi:MAG: DNA polymerase III subunit alpha, partial [Tenericutes bacterium]